ncbi:MAG: radical SAM protein [Flavobacteriales bacterium]|jgi:tRNA A37 methylthiotransferase MiaB|nr:radical SAM protein [Flavobacteriales bacterium]
MPTNVLLITPPFTQLNTSYPATCYLKGFLEHKGIPTHQSDLSIELFDRIFSKKTIEQIFELAGQQHPILLPQVWEQRSEYINKVETVINFLRTHETTTAYQLIHDSFLPRAHRFEKLEEDLSWAFGNLGILDKAKHYATLFIEELGDFIKANIDEFFSFTRYAERISSSASSFDELDEYLSYETTIIENELLKLLAEKLETYSPDLVCFSIPFPGNLFAALRCGQFIKQYFPKTKIAFGGGYCNTELRSLSDVRVFNYVDYITLDDGEAPLLRLVEHLNGSIPKEQLERTFLLHKNEVVYQNHIPNTIFHHKNLPAPSYEGLKHHLYLSFLDVMNPMHRLWSDGRWNKLTIAHGCYWKQCSFCDVTLDYIGNYQNTTADDLVNKIEAIIKETGVTGFHFVDEAAPPKMLKALANRLIERKVYITWWTNIRFEKTFTPELCQLLAKSGCIAVTGGLEVASDRLLAKMKKGVDIAQVARVTNSFANANIMVHAYLMYGFPTETEQETIDSLEVVRQLFINGCIHSAFWHQFSTTIHSPIGQNPEAYEIQITGPQFQGFAENDLTHLDPLGTEHTDFTEGLNLALNNYLNGLGLEEELQAWFAFEIPVTTVPEHLIETALTFEN